MIDKNRSIYKFRVSDEMAGFLRSLHPRLKKKVKAALGMIIDDPFCGKMLKEELQGLSSFRVGRFRIIYRITEGNIIDLVAVGPRKTIYEVTYSLIKRKEEKTGS